MKTLSTFVFVICSIIGVHSQQRGDRALIKALTTSSISNPSSSIYPTKPLPILPATQTSKSVLLQPKVLPGKKYDMAFFCRIEDKIARNSKVNFKFRLGSVSYVDALEGKGYFEALSYSKATNFRLSRTN